jgi:hypothetical protein
MSERTAKRQRRENPHKPEPIIEKHYGLNRKQQRQRVVERGYTRPGTISITHKGKEKK